MIHYLKKAVKAIYFLAVLNFFSRTTVSSVGLEISKEDNRLIQTCVEACRDFRASFDNFQNNMTSDNWSISKKEFSTCQWKCYRCSLTTGVYGMDQIEAVSSDFSKAESQKIVNDYSHDIHLSGYNCLNKWTVASLLGCSKDPVEKIQPFCRS